MGQTPRSRSQGQNDGTQGKVLPQGIFMWNIKNLELTVQKLLARLKFQRRGQNDRMMECQNDRQDKNNMPPIFDIGSIKSFVDQAGKVFILRQW